MTTNSNNTSSPASVVRPVSPAGQPAAPEPAGVRDHLGQLIASGGTYRSIATAAGIGPMTVHDLAVGRTRPHCYTVTALLAVSARDIERGRVDAGGTRLRLRALHVMGHGSARIARAAGASQRTIRALVTGQARTVSISVRDAITTVYEAWWDKRAPERDPGERAAATAARRRAIRGNWCAAAALDDDLLDTPGYKPAYGWKPALGTGTAPDIITRRSRQRGSGQRQRRRPA